MLGTLDPTHACCCGALQYKLFLLCDVYAQLQQQKKVCVDNLERKIFLTKNIFL